MASFTPFDIYKILPKTNCRICRLPSCLAFAAAVVSGERNLRDCPDVDPQLAKKYDNVSVGELPYEQMGWDAYEKISGEVASVDLAGRAERLGGVWRGKDLEIQCLGKSFAVNQQGKVLSQCHVIPWVTVPLLEYVLHGQGKDPIGKWVSLRELSNGKTWYPLFRRRCEQPLARLADDHPELFEDLVGLFGAAQTQSKFDSDIALILHPLPKLPVLICYWHSEDDLSSKLSLYFDQSADKNLSVESIHNLCVGLATMFEKIVQRHV
ncbi:MAG: DUF3786 domain-containing protein [Desulfobulbaceae bacterium]|nr:DUF3786 domain-containing protein [Desulfobulbaceae bacterium]